MSLDERAEVSGWVEAIGEALRASADPERARNEKRYLRSDLRFIGAGVPSIRKAIRQVVRRGSISERTTLLAFVDACWDGDVHELRVAGVLALQRSTDLLEARDLELVEALIRRSKTWAYVDPLSIHMAGALVERFPELGPALDRWAEDADFWVRRSAILALLGPLRRGEGDFDRFSRYADAMLCEREFFIRKAIGWTLREVSKKRPCLVYSWLAPRTHRIAGVAMREAVKYLPEDRRDELMAAYRGKRPASGS